MATTSRKRRGRETELWVAKYFRARGWPDAEAVGSSLPGRDIKNTLGLAWEIKARAGFDPLSALRQARKNAGNDLPSVILRMNGQGEESIGEFVVCRFLDDDIQLLREAGYGQRQLCGSCDAGLPMSCTCPGPKIFSEKIRVPDDLPS